MTALPQDGVSYTWRLLLVTHLYGPFEVDLKFDDLWIRRVASPRSLHVAIVNELDVVVFSVTESARCSLGTVLVVVLRSHACRT